MMDFTMGDGSIMDLSYMVDDNMRDDSPMDLDLNQAPTDPSTGSDLGLGSLLNELETAHDRIEDRIRQLEAVTARARQRQRWRQARNHLPETSNVLIETIGSTEGTGQNGNYSVERGKSCKRDSSHLVAKALELDTDAKKVVGEGGGFFDCNICLEMAREPVLTCCGHLFCWACFYQVPCIYSSAKECPVCKGEVTDSNITPIFGNGNNTHVSELESGVKVPPRPPAHRIESVRQQRVSRGISHIPVAEALRRIRMHIGRPQQQDLDAEPVTISSNPTNTDGQNPTSEVSSNTASVGGSRRLRSRQLSRALSVTAASLSSISSGLNNPRLLEDSDELHTHDTLLGRIRGQVQPVDGGHPFSSSSAVAQHHQQTVDSTAEINSAAALASSSQRTDVSSSDAPTEVNITEPSSSSRRRNRLSRVSEVDNGGSRAPRRRRLSFL